MEKITQTAKTVASTSKEEIKLDKQIKRVLACKPILSRILKEVVEECKDLTYEEVEACIEGDVIIDKIPLEPGLSNIVGLSQEDYENLEGMIRFDVRTYLKLPNESRPQLAKILIDIEAQKDENPGYDIPTRGLYYCSRMISSQLTTEFTTDSNDRTQYGNIKKVYSIWICSETSQKRANTIEKYSINKEMLYGTNQDTPRYDLLSAVVINLSKNNKYENVDNELIVFLSDLLNTEISINEKLKRLQQKHHLKITEKITEEVSSMCTYTTAVKEEGLAKGRAEEIFTSVQEGDYPVSRGAQKLDLSEDEFIKLMKENGYTPKC